MPHDGRHGDDCFGCRIKTIQFDPRATPSRRNTVAPRTANNSWEKGIAKDHRNMPILDKDLNPVGVKRYAAEKHKINEELRKARATSTTKD